MSPPKCLLSSGYSKVGQELFFSAKHMRGFAEQVCGAVVSSSLVQVIGGRTIIRDSARS